MYIHICIYIYICMYIYMCAYMYIYIYIYGRPPPPEIHPQGCSESPHSIYVLFLIHADAENAANTEGFPVKTIVSYFFLTAMCACRCQKWTTRIWWFVSGVTDFVLCLRNANMACLKPKQWKHDFRLSIPQKCCTVPIFWLAWQAKNRDSTALSPLQTAEVLYCPYFLLAWGRENRDSTALSPLQTAEVPYCPYFLLAGTNKVLYCP